MYIHIYITFIHVLSVLSPDLETQKTSMAAWTHATAA